jgi:DNA-binding response OmpR family regulator
MAKAVVVSEDSTWTERIVSAFNGCGFAVRHAPGVLEALELLGVELPDVVVVTDDLFPLTASDFLELRSVEQRLYSLPVLAIGAADTRRKQLLSAGADAFLAFPFEPDDVTACVEALLRRRSTGGLNGDFSSVSLIDVIQLLNASRAGGRLTVRHHKEEGVLIFDEGQLTFARFGNANAEEALYVMLRRANQSGTFSYEAGNHGAVPNISKRTDHLLLGLASALDEEKIAS